MRAAICDAIARRRLLAFTYRGHERLVEPHCHGTSSEGHELVRGFQVGGTGASGSLGWKLFDVSLIDDLRTIDQGFAPRPDFRRDDDAMHPVHCCV